MKNLKLKHKLSPAMTFLVALSLGSFATISVAGSANYKILYSQKSTGTQSGTKTLGNASSFKLNFSRNRDSRGRKLYRSKELVVRFKSTTSQSLGTQTVKQYGSLTAKRISFGKNKEFRVVKINAAESIHQVYARYKSDPNVASVSYNYMLYSLATPTDPSFGQQWGLRNTGQAVNGTTGTSGSDMGLQLAWDTRTDCSSVIVAVLDTGVNYTHQDLALNIPAAMQTLMRDFTVADPTKPGASAYPQAGHESHGTHVAGIIGARANNGLGTVGVCWQAKILPLRVLDEDGSGSASSIAEGIKYAADNGAKVINMSLGGRIGGVFVTGDDNILSAAMDTARTAGVVVVVAAGNDGTDNDAAPIYPCNLTHDNIICVAAMNQSGGRASFSNTGSNSVDVGAPGTNTYSTFPGVSLTIANANTGWMRTSATGPWAEVACNFTNGSIINLLVNPSTLCGGTGTYSNAANDVVYKAFDLSSFAGAQQVSVIGIYSGDLEYDPSALSGAGDGDEFTVMASPGTADPFILATGFFTTLYGSTFGQFLEGGFKISANCFVSTCTIGIRLLSRLTATTATGSGVGVSLFNFVSVSNAPGAGAYQYLGGTSMASPHVAGLAALLIAQNPGFTYLDTINAIKSGGVVNAAFVNTTSGRTVSAIGSLRYTATPTGVSVTVP